METLSGVHHFYLGIFVALLGFVLLWGSRDWMATVGIIVCVFGLVIMADDIFQHAMQRFYMNGYASPLKKVYRVIVQVCPAFGQIVDFIDAIFRGNNPMR